MPEGKSQITERAFIDWIRGRTKLPARLVEIGPGDDAALVRHSASRVLLAIDTIAEGVDFTLESAKPAEIGRKALAVNLSDIAAMGGRPLWCMASVALTKGLGAAFGKGLYGGLERLAGESKCPLVGGDITTWTQGVVATVAIGGVPAGRSAVRRNGARPGDVVFVTGTLGGSLEGKHLRFTPRLTEGAWLAREFPPTAMIDISDGLGVDAAHIAEESGVAIEIDAERIPVSTAAERLSAGEDVSPVRHAVRDGEDFELLFTMPPSRAAKVLEKWRFKTALTVIGKVRKGRGVWLAGGPRKERIDTEGYQHAG